MINEKDGDEVDECKSCIFICTAYLNENNKYEYGLTDEDVEKAIEILNCPLIKSEW